GLIGERGTVSPASNCTITAPGCRVGELGEPRDLHAGGTSTVARAERLAGGAGPPRAASRASGEGLGGRSLPPRRRARRTGRSTRTPRPRTRGPRAGRRP